MTELMRLIQQHLDRYGVTRAEFARRAGTSPQTVQNWMHEIRALPDAKHLQGVADVIGVPYVVVLDAALADAGYLNAASSTAADIEARVRAAADADDSVIDHLWVAVNRIKAEHVLAGPETVDPTDLLTRILRQQTDAGMPMAARTEDYPKQD
jgi:transcriptional regulator with XRE-family HTH domain